MIEIDPTGVWVRDVTPVFGTLDGFSWDRYGLLTEARRHGSARLFDTAPPEPRRRRPFGRR